MTRLTAFASIVAIATFSRGVDGQDMVRKELEKAKAAYQKEKEAYRTSILEAFDKREEAARKAADK